MVTTHETEDIIIFESESICEIQLHMPHILLRTLEQQQLRAYSGARVTADHSNRREVPPTILKMSHLYLPGKIPRRLLRHVRVVICSKPREGM